MTLGQLRNSNGTASGMLHHASADIASVTDIPMRARPAQNTAVQAA